MYYTKINGKEHNTQEVLPIARFKPLKEIDGWVFGFAYEAKKRKPKGLYACPIGQSFLAFMGEDFTKRTDAEYVEKFSNIDWKAKTLVDNYNYLLNLN